MATYDKDVIHQFADSLYSKAKSIIVNYTMLGALIGGGIGLVTQQMITAAILSAVFGLVGLSMGRDKAFQLKLQAQVALCQVKIEENTRGRFLKE